MQSVRKVACPRCGAAALFGPANRWRPFCSERCRMIDLGQWAEERYRVPSQEGPEDAADAEAGVMPKPHGS